MRGPRIETKAEITLRNVADVGKFTDGLITEGQVRQVTVTAKVDTGAYTLYLDEETYRKLGLGVAGTKMTRVANGARVETTVTRPVEVRWNDRFMSCNARVLPGLSYVLLGQIPLEDMDLMVDPKRQRLAGVHGDEALEDLF